MFKLRHKVYVEREKYISKDNTIKTADIKEIDSYDESGKCVYFAAVVNGEMVGSTRIIRTNPLPIQKNYYSFEEPDLLKDVSAEKKVEIGRLISTGHYGDISLPKHLIMLGMFDSIVQYAKNNEIIGGYGAVKVKILSKFKKMSIPVRKIDSYEVIYSSENEDPLDNFFNNPQSPVVPIFFIDSDMIKYFNNFFSCRLLFKKIDEKTLVYKGNNLRFLFFVILKKIKLL